MGCQGTTADQRSLAYSAGPRLGGQCRCPGTGSKVRLGKDAYQPGPHRRQPVSFSVWVAGSWHSELFPAAIEPELNRIYVAETKRRGLRKRRTITRVLRHESRASEGNWPQTPSARLPLADADSGDRLGTHLCGDHGSTARGFDKVVDRSGPGRYRGDRHL